MRDSHLQLPPHTAVLVLAEIKRTIAAFDDGETNVRETLEAITSLLDHENLLERQQPTRRAA
jgi:hypothetical protein